MNQKVPKKSELFDHKKSSRTILLTMRELLFIKLQEKWGFSPHKRNKCRIRLVDKFGIYYVCVAPNGVQGRVFALNGVRGDSINVFPMIPMRGACPSCTTSLYLPDVFCSNRFCGFFESLEVLACFNLKHKARPCFPRGTKGAFPISFYLVSDIGIVSIFARRAQEPDFFIIPLWNLSWCEGSVLCRMPFCGNRRMRCS